MNNKGSKTEPILAFIPEFNSHINITKLVELLRENKDWELSPHSVKEDINEGIRLINLHMKLDEHSEYYEKKHKNLLNTLYFLEDVFSEMNILK